jgi:hypothetical protein
MLAYCGDTFGLLLWQEKRREHQSKLPPPQLTQGRGALPTFLGQLSRQVEPFLGVNLGRGKAAVAEHGLGRFESVIVADQLGFGVPQLVRGPLSDTRSSELLPAVRLQQWRVGELSQGMSDRLAVGVRSVTLLVVQEFGFGFAIFPRHASVQSTNRLMVMFSEY